MAYYGLNTRQSAAYVTDGATETALVQIAGPALQNYPTTANGLTFGFVSGGDVNNFRDRNSALDPRLAGMWFNNAATKTIIRLDLPSGAGTYDICLALGDDASGWSHTCEIQDGTTTFTTISASSGTSQWVDAGGTARNAATWVSSNTKLRRTFSSSFVRIVLGDGVGAGPNSTIAHLSVELVSGSGPTINTQPAGSFATVGATTTYSVTGTTSGGTLTYQWQQSSDGATWASVSGGSGATSATYTTPAAVSAANGLRYRCVLTDSNGSATTSAVWFFVSGLPSQGKARIGGAPGTAIWLRQRSSVGDLNGRGAHALRSFPSRANRDNADLASAWSNFFFPPAPAAPVPTLAPMQLVGTRRNRPGRGPYSVGKKFRSKLLAYAPASSATVSGTMPEALTLAETAAAQATFASTQAEALALSETPAAQGTFASAQAEALALAETPAAVRTQASAQAEALALAETPAAQAVSAAAQAEALALAETPASQAVFASAQAEALALSESTNGTLVGSSSDVAEALALSDTPASQAVFASTRPEALALAETPASQAVFASAAAEALALSETTNASVTAAGTGAVSEALALADTPASQQVSTSAQAEALALAETTTGGIAVAVAAVEAMSLADTCSAALVRSAVAAESMALSDQAAANGVLQSVVAEAMVLAESVASQVSALIAVAEAMALAEQNFSTLASEPLSDAWRYDVQPSSLQYDVQPGSLQFDVPSIASAIDIA